MFKCCLCVEFGVIIDMNDCMVFGIVMILEEIYGDRMEEVVQVEFQFVVWEQRVLMLWCVLVLVL